MLPDQSVAETVPVNVRADLQNDSSGLLRLQHFSSKAGEDANDLGQILKVFLEELQPLVKVRTRKGALRRAHSFSLLSRTVLVLVK